MKLFKKIILFIFTSILVISTIYTLLLLQGLNGLTGAIFSLDNKYLILSLIGMIISLVGILCLKFKEGKWIELSTITILLSAIMTRLILFTDSLKVDKDENIYKILHGGSINYADITIIITVLILVTYIIITIIKAKKKLNN